MGNSKLAQGCQTPSAPPSREPDPDNGILAQVPGDLIALGLNTLPPPSASSSDSHEIVIDARELGRLRLSVKKNRTRHGRSSHYYWSAWRAELENPPSFG